MSRARAHTATSALRREPRSNGEEKGKVLGGRDFAGRRARRRRLHSAGSALLIGLVLGGLLLVSLRMGIVRTRYSLADALSRETVLLERARQARVDLRELRDPRRLRRLANELGFARPEHVIELDTESVAP